jgi:hypothetical protein
VFNPCVALFSSFLSNDIVVPDSQAVTLRHFSKNRSMTDYSSQAP